MRRKDREVTDPDKIREIIENSEILRIGYYDSGEIYIVPVNFGFTEKMAYIHFIFMGQVQAENMSCQKMGVL